MKGQYDSLKIDIPAFYEKKFPIEYTGWGEDKSPEIHLHNIKKEAVSVAIIMEDLDVPMTKAFSHWVIWNLPPLKVIPKGIPYGAKLQIGEGATQGMAYGKHCYKGPKPPIFIKKPHRYVFHVYALNCRITLPKEAKKKELLGAIEDGGKIVQYGYFEGIFSNRFLSKEQMK